MAHESHFGRHGGHGGENTWEEADLVEAPRSTSALVVSKDDR